MRRFPLVLAAIVATLAVSSCADGHEGPRTLLTRLGDLTRLDRLTLERGLAVDIEAVAVFHDPSWERLVIQQDGHCVAVDAAGVDPPLTPGERLRVRGFTAFERNGPVIVLPRLARLPNRGVRAWTRTSSLSPVEGVACLELQAHVRGVRQLDSEHLRLDASVDGAEVDGIVMDIANSALLREGETVILRGPVEMLPPADHAAKRWRIYLQGAGAFERVGVGPPAPRPPAPGRAATEATPLTPLLQIKALSAEEAGRGLPVRVRGVVTGASARDSGGAQEIILQDADCGIYATTERATEAASFGSLVELEGRTAPGAFAPIVVYSNLRVLGRAPLPPPLPVTGLDVRLSSRTENGWTVVKGVLRPHAGDFAVASPEGELPLYLFTGELGRLQRFVDAEVEVSGVFAVIHRARRVVGYRLLVQSPDQVVLNPSAEDAGASTIWPISQLFAYWPSGRPLRRISIRGAVTGVFHPNRVYVDDGTAGVLCETSDPPPAIGAIVTASGFLPASGPEHRLTRAQLQPTGPQTAAVAPLLTIEEILGGDQDGRLVSMVGLLRERTRSMGREWLTLEVGQYTISAVLELPAPIAAIERLRAGTELRVTGIGQMDWDRSRVPPRVRAARLLLRSANDLEVLRAASWWTRERIGRLLATVIALAAISLVWLVSLRRQVGQQTQVIRAQMTRLRDEGEERERARQKLEKSLDEQTSLLREVHHRVKNNLQAIIHLMEMERDRIGDPRATALLDGLSERARTMALVYEQVYQLPSVARVDMDAYLHALGERLQGLLSAGRAIDVDVHAPGVSLDVATAMPCGLIVNELLTNAFKYAFPPAVSDGGRIMVRLTEAAGIVRLEVADDGVGMSEDRRPEGTLGLELVSLWATHQLGGRLTVRVERGTAFTVEFAAQPA
jgi:two-component sensor histidine kinase